MIEITSPSKELQLSYQNILKLYNHVTMEAHLRIVIKYLKNGESVQMNSFYYNTVKTWNELPKIVTHAKNINVTHVVNLKFVFTDQFVHNLIVLIK